MIAHPAQLVKSAGQHPPQRGGQGRHAPPGSLDRCATMGARQADREAAASGHSGGAAAERRWGPAGHPNGPRASPESPAGTAGTGGAQGRTPRLSRQQRLRDTASADRAARAAKRPRGRNAAKAADRPLRPRGGANRAQRPNGVGPRGGPAAHATRHGQGTAQQGQPEQRAGRPQRSEAGPEAQREERAPTEPHSGAHGPSGAAGGKGPRPGPNLGAKRRIRPAKRLAGAPPRSTAAQGRAPAQVAARSGQKRPGEKRGQTGRAAPD